MYLEQKMTPPHHFTMPQQDATNKFHMYANPEQIAKSYLATNALQKEGRPVKKIIRDLMQIHARLENRWKAIERYDLAKQNGHTGKGLTFLDETGNPLPCKSALDPCPVVNQSLSAFVNLTLKLYSHDKCEKLFEQIAQYPNIKSKIDTLRQIAIRAEESMEKKALEFIFKMHEAFPKAYANSVQEMAKKCRLENPEMDPKMAMLKALVVLTPKEMQQRVEAPLKGFIFPYFKNYIHLVDSELELLTRPNMVTQKGYSFPELKHKQFTFVGAGFPLSGIILNIRTQSNITLVDRDKKAVKNAQKFISLCETFEILPKGSVQVVHADALELYFSPLKKVHQKSQQRNYESQKLSTQKDALQKDAIHKDTIQKGSLTKDMPQNRYKKIHTDILDLASAIPSTVTDEILKSHIQPDVLVRKRNVQGISALLYEHYQLQQNTPYKVIAEVTTPQDALKRLNLNRVVGITQIDNVNSCELLKYKKENESVSLSI